MKLEIPNGKCNTVIMNFNLCAFWSLVILTPVFHFKNKGNLNNQCSDMSQDDCHVWWITIRFSVFSIKDPGTYFVATLSSLRGNFTSFFSWLRGLQTTARFQTFFETVCLNNFQEFCFCISIKH